MNFFRSEEHLRSWEGFRKGREGGMISLADAMRLFSGPFFTRRRESDYFSHMARYSAQMIPVMESLEHAGSYWRLKRLEKLVFSLVLKLKSK
jgi:hypothetical protein